MAFVATRGPDELNLGTKRGLFGTFTNDTTGGTIAVGDINVEHFSCTGATAWTQSGGTANVITVTTSSTAGSWFLFGNG